MKANVTVLFLIISFYSFAQKNLDVTWGAWGDSSFESEAFFSLGKSFEDTTGYLLVNKSGKLEYFDEALHKRYEADLFGGGKNTKVMLAKRLGHKAYLVVLENETACKVYKYDYRTKTAEFERDIFEIKKTDVLQPSVSSDSSYYVFSTYSSGKTPVVNFFVTDSLFKVKWERRNLPVQATDKYFIEPTVNSQGDVAFADTDKESFLVRVLSQKGKIHKPSAFSFLGERYVNVKSTSNEDAFVFALLYNKENINYNCAENLQVIHAPDANVAPISQSLSLDDCIDNQMIMHLNLERGGILRIVCETFSNNRNDSNNRCTYGSLWVLGVDVSAGSLLWKKEIFKNLYFVGETSVIASPYSADYLSDFGHGYFEYKKDIYFLYGDNCQNCINTVTNPKSHSNLKNSCLALVSIDEHGVVMRHTYSSMPNVKYKVDAQSFVSTCNGCVIFKSNGKQSRLGLVKLNRRYK